MIGSEGEEEDEEKGESCEVCVRRRWLGLWTRDIGIPRQMDGWMGGVVLGLYSPSCAATYCAAINMQQLYSGELSRSVTARTSARILFYELRDHGSRIGSVEYQERLGAVLQSGGAWYCIFTR